MTKSTTWFRSGETRTLIHSNESRRDGDRKMDDGNSSRSLTPLARGGTGATSVTQSQQSAN